MSLAGSLKIVALVLAMSFVPSDTIPSTLIGSWDVKMPYTTPGPIGIDAAQEKRIRNLHPLYTADHLRVCGKDVPVQPIKTKSLTSDQFLQAYGFLPRVIGMDNAPVTDLTLNSSDGMNACGEYEDPGVHIFLGGNGNIVMEVANDYFPLKKHTAR